MKNKQSKARGSIKGRDDFVKNPCEGDESDSSENDISNSDRIENTGSAIICRNDSVIYCLTIIGQIEGHYILSQQNKTTKYEHIIPLLVSIEEDDRIDGLLVMLNTAGGDVEAGLAIAELISGMKKPTVSLVLGGGHSIGIPLAVAAKKSFIAKSASMTVHRFAQAVLQSACHKLLIISERCRTESQHSSVKIPKFQRGVTTNLFLIQANWLWT